MTANEFTEWTDTELAHARPSNLDPRDAKQLLEQIESRRQAGTWNPGTVTKVRRPRSTRR